MSYMMLRCDLLVLEDKIAEGIAEVKRIGEEMGESCRQGAETWHDNFAFEEGQRLMQLWQTRIRELNDIRSKVVLTEPFGSLCEVSFGRKVMLLNLDTEDIVTYKIGSYVSFTEEEGAITISYTSPLAQLIMGAKHDEVREGELGNGHKRFKIIMVF